MTDLSDNYAIIGYQTKVTIAGLKVAAVSKIGFQAVHFASTMFFYLAQFR